MTCPSKSTGANRDPAWSPDGARIAYTSNRTGFMDLYVMDEGGSNVMPRGFAPGDPIARSAWSPDGSRIAFTSKNCTREFVRPNWQDYDASCSQSIKYVTVDGSQEGLIVSDGHSPSWRR
jgi:Tol biopolymer transport system component